MEERLDSMQEFMGEIAMYCKQPAEEEEHEDLLSQAESLREMHQSLIKHMGTGIVTGKIMEVHNKRVQQWHEDCIKWTESVCLKCEPKLRAAAPSQQ